jgi:hypothetical protein
MGNVLPTDLAAQTANPHLDRVYQSIENRAKSYLQSSSGQRQGSNHSVSKVTREEQVAKNERMVRLKQFLKKDAKFSSKVLQEDKQKVLNQPRSTSTNFFMMKQGSLPISQKEESKASPFSLATLDKTHTTQRYRNHRPNSKQVLVDITHGSVEKHSTGLQADPQAQEIFDEALDVGIDSIHQSYLDLSQSGKKNILRSTLQDLKKLKPAPSSTGNGWRLRTSDKILSDQPYHKRMRTGEPKKRDPFELLWTDLLDISWEIPFLKKDAESKDKGLDASSYPTPFIPIRLQDYIGAETSLIASEHDWFLPGRFLIVLKTNK